MDDFAKDMPVCLAYVGARRNDEHKTPMSHALEIIRLHAGRAFRATSGCALAIGNFDGLHLGHRAVIGAMRAHAEQHRLVPAVLSFSPHPRLYFKPASPAFLLMRPRERFVQLQQMGVQRLYLATFNQALATTSAQDFCDVMLRDSCHAKAVFVGDNFVFGANRGGDVTSLKAWGEAHNIYVHAETAMMHLGSVCSSSQVRLALAEGDMRRVRELLGRDFAVNARVIHGDARGRTLGFPTANMPLVSRYLLPPYGVYVVSAILPDGVQYDGVANLGIRPSFGGDSAPRLEVHLFDYSGNLYGKKLTVALRHFLRPEQRFASVEELQRQIAEDANAARNYVRELKHDL